MHQWLKFAGRAATTCTVSCLVLASWVASPAWAEKDSSLGGAIDSQTRADFDTSGDTVNGTITKPGRDGSRADNSDSSRATSKRDDSSTPERPPADKRPPTQQELAAYREAMARWARLMQICQSELNLWGGAGVTGADCFDKAGPPPTAPTPTTTAPEPDDPTPQLDPAVLAQRAVATLTLPTVTPKVGPPPSVNQWHIAAVGYPLWLWTTGPATRTASVSLDGVTLTLTARRVATRFDMGEPDARPVVCTTTTAWTPSVEPAQPSPDCGYTYQHASITQAAPDGTYTVRATERWEVTWAALGATGVIPLQTSGTTTLPVGEIQTVRLP